MAIATREGLETIVKGGCISASVTSCQDLANAPCVVVCSSFLKSITLIINDPGRLMFVTKKRVGKAEETSLDQSGRWKMLWYVCFGSVHLCVQGTCKHTSASVIASESLWALLWGLIYCLGSGLSSLCSLSAASGYGQGLDSPLSALTVINKDTHFLGFAPIFLKDLSANGEDAEIINHRWHVKGLRAASLGEAVI